MVTTPKPFLSRHFSVGRHRPPGSESDLFHRDGCISQLSNWAVLRSTSARLTAKPMAFWGACIWTHPCRFMKTGSMMTKLALRRRCGSFGTIIALPGKKMSANPRQTVDFLNSHILRDTSHWPALSAKIKSRIFSLWLQYQLCWAAQLNILQADSSINCRHPQHTHTHTYTIDICCCSLYWRGIAWYTSMEMHDVPVLVCIM